MNTEKIIAVKDIKKAFKVYLDHGNTLKEKIITRERGKYQKREVLKGISFDVKRRSYWINRKKWLWKEYNFKTFN